MASVIRRGEAVRPARRRRRRGRRRGRSRARSAAPARRSTPHRPAATTRCRCPAGRSGHPRAAPRGAASTSQNTRMTHLSRRVADSGGERSAHDRALGRRRQHPVGRDASDRRRRVSRPLGPVGRRPWWGTRGHVRRAVTCSGGRRAARGSRQAHGTRAVAQLGSALDWGSGGRRFKSCQPDSVMSQDIGIVRTDDSSVRTSAFRGGIRTAPQSASDISGCALERDEHREVA